MVTAGTVVCQVIQVTLDRGCLVTLGIAEQGLQVFLVTRGLVQRVDTAVTAVCRDIRVTVVFLDTRGFQVNRATLDILVVQDQMDQVALVGTRVTQDTVDLAVIPDLVLQVLEHLGLVATQDSVDCLGTLGTAV